MGNKILRQRLKGPSIAAYYPRRVVTLKDFENTFKPYNLIFDNEAEIDRLDHLDRFADTLGLGDWGLPDISQTQSTWKGCPQEEEGSPSNK